MYIIVRNFEIITNNYMTGTHYSLIIFISLLVSNIQICIAQSPTDVKDSVTVYRADEIKVSEFQTFKMPPLEILLDSAVALSPERRYALLIAEEERINFKSAKLNLLNMLSLRASYNYGQIAGNYLQESEIYQPILTYSKTNQDYVNTGVYLSVSIADILDIRHKKKITQLRIQRQIEDGERVAREVKISVINEYRKLQLALTNLNAKSEKLNINKTQYQLAQNKFEKGVLDIHSLSNIRTSYSDAQVDYETSANEVLTCMLILETLTGVQLIK